MEIKGLKQNNLLLPSSRWTLANMRVREEAEINSGGFGKGKLVEISDEGHATTIEEYKYMLDTLMRRVESYRSRYDGYLRDAINDYPESDVWLAYQKKIADMFTIVSTNEQLVKEGNAPDPTDNIISKSVQNDTCHVEKSDKQVNNKDKDLSSERQPGKKDKEARELEDYRGAKELDKEPEKKDMESIVDDDFWSDPEVTAKIIEQMDTIEKEWAEKKNDHPNGRTLI